MGCFVIEYRPASYPDVDEIVTLGRFFQREHKAFSALDYYPPKVVDYVMQHIQDPVDELYLATRGGSIIGMLFASSVPVFFGTSRIGVDGTFYVDPRYRGYGVGETLLSMYEAWASKHKIPVISIAVTSGIHPDETQALLEKLDYSYVGPNMVKRVA